MCARLWIFVSTLAVATLLAASCAADDPVGISGRFGDGDSVDAGLVAFRDAGCAVCHGQDGEGNIGPAMGGHSAEQVRRQVRGPLGGMPLFFTSELDEESLDLIVGFVEGLEPVDHGSSGGHASGGDSSELNPRDVLIGHHWMAISAMLVGDVAEAEYHIRSINKLVTGEHLAAMGEVVALLEAGDIDSAQIETTEMLAGFLPEAGAIDELHVRLALQALSVDDVVEAVGHLERVGDGVLEDSARQALVALGANDTDNVIELLTAALGDGDHGDMNMDMNMEMDMNMNMNMDTGHDDGRDHSNGSHTEAE